MTCNIAAAQPRLDSAPKRMTIHSFSRRGMRQKSSVKEFDTTLSAFKGRFGHQQCMEIYRHKYRLLSKAMTFSTCIDTGQSKELGFQLYEEYPWMCEAAPSAGQTDIYVQPRYSLCARYGARQYTNK